jgi:hypothetical protein
VGYIAACTLDTDLYIRRSMDHAFNLVQFGKIAGAFRGFGNFSLKEPRPAASIKTADKIRGGGNGGGVNGGCIVFNPDQETGEQLVEELQFYDPPDQTGGEQDYLSQYFGMKENIQQLDHSF